MGTVLPGGEAAEVIPFDYDAPVLYYPVRHHSPACAWHLERAMERYRPELVLVEGPENANDLISILASPETRAPVVLYYAYRDDAGLLRGAAGLLPLRLAGSAGDLRAAPGGGRPG